jgi:hypothetical protein
VVVTNTMVAGELVGNYLGSDDGDDLLEEMVRMVAELLMDGEVDLLCRAGYGERTETQGKSRNGHRRRRFKPSAEPMQHDWRGGCDTALRSTGWRGTAGREAPSPQDLLADQDPLSARLKGWLRNGRSRTGRGGRAPDDRYSARTGCGRA